jgi:hypothetical protein
VSGVGDGSGGVEGCTVPLDLGLKMMKVAKFHYLWLWMQKQNVSVIETMWPGLDEHASDSSKCREISESWRS